MSEEIELKECPFCDEIHNSDVELYSRSRIRIYINLIADDHIYFVKCEACGCQGPYYFSEEEAIAAWNTRHESGELPGWLIKLLKSNISHLEDEHSIATFGAPMLAEHIRLLKWVLSMKKPEEHKQ